MAQRNIDIVLSRGINQGVDPRVAPEGTLRRVENFRIRRDGRLGLRNGYVALDRDTFGGNTLTAYDVARYQDRLIALGNSSSANQTGIRALYEYMDVDAGTWRTTNESDEASFAQLPLCTDLETIFDVDDESGMPDPFTGSSSNILEWRTDSDFGGGVVAFVYASFTNTTATSDSVYAIFLDPEDGQILYRFRVGTGGLCQVIHNGNRFFIFYKSASTTITVVSFDPTTDTTIQSVGTITTVSSFTTFRAKRHEGTTNFVVAYRTASTTLRVDFYNDSFVSQWNQSVTTANTPYFDVAGDTAFDGSGIVFLAYVHNTADVVVVQAFGEDATPGSSVSLDFVGGVSVPGVSFPDKTRITINIALDSTNDKVHAVLRDFDDILGCLYYDDAWTGGGNPVQFFSNVKEASGLVVDNGVPFFWTGTSEAISSVGGSFVLLSAGSELVHANLYAGLQYAFNFDVVTPRIHSGDGGYYYCTFQKGRDTGSGVLRRPSLVRFKLNSTDRRETIQHGNYLYLSGGALSEYDGVAVHESGFIDNPIISNVGSSTSGNLDDPGTYTHYCLLKYSDRFGDIGRSTLSNADTVSISGQDSINVFTRTIFSSRRGLNYFAGTEWEISDVDSPTIGTNNAPGKVFVDIFRTENGGTIPRLVASVPLIAQDGEKGFAKGLSFIGGTSTSSTEYNDGLSDSSVQSKPTPYTFNGRRGTTAPSPARFLVSVNGRIALGGLPNGSEFQLSEEPRPGEVTGFVNDDFAFGKIPGTISAVSGLDGQKIFFTEEGDIYLVEGDGANSAGIGELGEPRKLPSSAGCKDSRSVIETEFGVFFQGDDDKLYLIPRGSLAPIWAGQGIRDILEASPFITSACHHLGDNLVTFTCVDSETSPVTVNIVHLDVRTSGFGPGGFLGNWITDNPSLAPLASVEFEDRLVIVSSENIIYQVQTGFADPSSSFITGLIETATIYPTGPGNNGRLMSIVLTGEYRDDCVLNCFVSYDDGQNFTQLTSKSLTGLTAGQTVRHRWVPGRFDGVGFRVRVTFSEYNSGGPSEGFAPNTLSLKFASLLSPTKLGSSSRS